MPQFAYAARDSRGQVMRGTIEADNSSSAAARLRSEGYFVTSISSGAAAGQSEAGGSARGVKVNAKTLSLFCEQMGTLLRAGVPVTSALRVTAMQSGKRGWSEVLDKVRRHVEAGESLSGAMGHYSRSFPDLMLRLLEAGETSGSLDATFQRLAGHYQRDYELRQKVIGSMTYPAVIFCVAIGVVAILITYVLPKFVDMFSGMGVDLPAPTKALIAVGTFVQQHGFLTLVALVALIVGSMAYLRTEAGLRAKDRLLLSIPLVRDFVHQSELARFARSYGTLLSGGVPALQGMQIVARVARNRVIAQAFQSVADMIRGGASLASSMERTGVMPPLMLQMISVGETTGSLDLILESVAGYYEKEVEGKVKQLTTLIEPAIILVVGIIVASIVSSVMLPMFDMLGSFQ